MRSLLLNPRDVEFLLYEWLDAQDLTSQPRFSEHSRETFDGALELSQTVAERHFAPHNRRNDLEEPTFDGQRVHLHPEIAEALEVFRETGLMSAGMPAAVGGMQLPATITTACFAWFQAANISTSGYPFLTIANANLLLAHGSQEQIQDYVLPMLEGRYFGTMCLSEPQAGSSLADVTVRAEPQPDGSYRLFGNKMWISGGDHEMTENIIHLVLARVPGAPAGVKGLSLFIVPKWLPDGQRNDVVLAGLNHKMGFRGTTNTLLNFGENGGAQGYLVGEQNRGLAYMFHMMNEARIGVGVGAVALGYAGYLHSLEYARTRLQGRPLTDRDPASAQIPIIEHPDVRRMLLAQKSYVEGGLALSLYCAKLVDTDDPLLDLLTPIAKSWPSQWCLAANDLAIQVHGGYGYTRDYPVEQFYRDNRLNPIHEGTHGIQALDLLGRKVVQDDGALLSELLGRINATCEAAEDEVVWAMAGRLAATTMRLWSTRDPNLALANASVYLEAFGHVVIAWLWLEQLLAVGDKQGAFYDGKRAAAAYFLRYELPKVGPQLDLLDSLERLTLEVDPKVL
jgi:butyryl-CoA dehydrogenase